LLSFIYLTKTTWHEEWCIYTVCQKNVTLNMFISLPIINRFSKFFHWHTFYTIGNKVSIEYPTTFELCATLPCII